MTDRALLVSMPNALHQSTGAGAVEAEAHAETLAVRTKLRAKHRRPTSSMQTRLRLPTVLIACMPWLKGDILGTQRR